VTHRKTVPLLALCFLLAGCSDSGEGLAAGCAKAELKTVEAGRFTLSTGPVTRSPWVSGPKEDGRSADPRNGKGYDAAVGFELAERLGFERSDVRWVATPFADALAKGSKRFDVNINQITIRDDRATNVDFSDPYHDVRYAVVGLKGGKAEQADSVDDVQGLRVGYVTGASTEAAIDRALGAKVTATSYPNDDELRRALTGGQADVVVTTYLHALRLDAEETRLVDGELVGVLADAPTTGERFGLVLEKGSPLTACVNEALDAMRRDGTLEQLERTWLAEDNGWAWLD